MASRVAETMSGTVLELVTTFGTWVLADRLHVSPVLAVVAFAWVVARDAPARQTPRDRVHSYAVWGSLVFILNVLAFLVMGLQAKSILSRLAGDELWRAVGFAGLVLAVVIVVRVAWVMFVAVVLRRPRRQALVVSWCGMRGLLTLATAFALPASFPGRDLIVLCAFTVVLGTLVLQGLTIGPLLRVLRLAPDPSLDEEVSFGRTAMIEAAVATLDGRKDAAANAVRKQLEAAREVARDAAHPQAATEYDRLRMSAIAAERAVLASLRYEGRIADDAFHRLEEELDWSELDAAPQGHFHLEET
jgi:CPA1 family monovalent cation:H+ antiporter